MGRYSGSPYWDRYDGDSEHRSKGYTRVLAVPGRAEQAAEFNEIQSISRDYIERLGNAMFNDGSIISGCSINIDGNTAVIESGRIFLGGLVREVSGVSLTITGSGIERILVSLSTSIVTSAADSSLRDPAIGAENYNLVGADRERQVVIFSVVSGDSFDSENSAVLYTLNDGELLRESSGEDKYAFINDILAERTYDENGNYRVQGLNLQSVPEITNNDKIKIHISSGRAYIKGYQVVKNAMSHIELNRSTATRFVQSESHYYKSTQDTYQLTNGPVESVSNVTALVTVTGERHYRGNIRGGSDSLNYTPVDSITRVWSVDSNSIETEYRQGIDYQLYADQVDWSLTGDDAREPEGGTTYYVTYVYNKSLTENTDFELTNDLDDSYITFLAGGTHPDSNTRVYFSYNYTLARRDLILLDSNGMFSVIEGIPDRYDDLITPYNGSDSFLELGYINVFAKDSRLVVASTDHLAEVFDYRKTRLTQDNFISMLRRIDALEESMAVLDMEREFEEGEDTSSLKGYFTDSFENINKSDLGYSNGDVSYTACIDFDRGEITTTADIFSYEMEIEPTSSSGYQFIGDIIASPYEYQLALKQEYVTGSMLVNPYASYGPMCQVLLDPKIDNWVDEQTVKVNNTVENKTYTTTTKTYSHGWWSRSATKNLRNFWRTETKTTTSLASRTVGNVVTSSVAETLIEYMRQRDIAITGSAFGANSSNLYATFNGIPVDLVATNSTVEGNLRRVNGTNYRTVNANANGYFTAKITVPSGVPCGKADIHITSPASGNFEGVDTVGSAIYSAQGTLLTTTMTNTKVINEHYNVLIEVDNLYGNDPLAQSFMLSDTYDRNLMKIGLYFATKSTTRPAVLQIRNMVNGYPGETVYAEVKIDPDEVNLPTNPNVPVVTEVVLNQPVYCYAGVYYCFVVLSDSNEYSLYYAELGKNLLGTTQQLVVNPYPTGVMFSSSNSTTWTAHQGADLKFELYRSYYTGNGEIIFKPVSTVDVSGLLLDAAYEVKGDDTVLENKSGLTWYYRYTESSVSGTTLYSDWLPIDTFVFRDLQSIADKIQLRAVITTDFSTSPFIDAKRVSLRSFVDDVKATYISKHLTKTEFDEPYQKMKVSYQVALPAGASHMAFYMDEEDGEWIELVEDDSDNAHNVVLTTTKVDEEFTKFEWEVNLLNCKKINLASEGSRFFKFRFDLSTSVRYNRPRVRKFATIFRYD